MHLLPPGPYGSELLWPSPHFTPGKLLVFTIASIMYLQWGPHDQGRSLTDADSRTWPLGVPSRFLTQRGKPSCLLHNKCFDVIISFLEGHFAYSPSCPSGVLIIILRLFSFFKSGHCSWLICKDPQKVYSIKPYQSLTPYCELVFKTFQPDR